MSRTFESKWIIDGQQHPQEKKDKKRNKITKCRRFCRYIDIFLASQKPSKKYVSSKNLDPNQRTKKRKTRVRRKTRMCMKERQDGNTRRKKMDISSKSRTSSNVRVRICRKCAWARKRSRQTFGQAGRKTYRQEDRKTDRKTERETDRKKMMALIQYIPSKTDQNWRIDFCYFNFIAYALYLVIIKLV